jgi:hypothetical protein
MQALRQTANAKELRIDPDEFPLHELYDIGMERIE